MKKFLMMGLCLGWAAVAGAAELSMDFTFSADDVTLTPVGDYTVVGLADGARPMDEVGAPAIPAKFVNILLPAGAENISISANGAATLLAEGIVPRPAQPQSPKSKPRPAFVAANARYADAGAWPAEVATDQGDHDMQGFRFVSVRLNPLTYVGAEKKLYLREKITVTARYEVAAQPRAISAKQNSLFAPLVNSLVANPGSSSVFAPQVRAVEPRAAVDYLIITSAALSNAFQQLANYRASAAGGSYTTRVLTTNDIGAGYSGADIQAKIRACISNYVAAQGTTMVVLGGDDTIVLDRNCSVSVVSQDTYETEMPTDLYYSGLNGSWNADGDAIYGETNDTVDMAWDVVVGRIPVRTATQATNYLNKVMTYEAGSPVTNKIILGGPEAWDTYSGTGRPSDTMVDGHAGFRSTSPAHTYVSDSEAWLRRLYRDGIYSNWPATVGIMCDTLTSWDSTTCGDHSESTANTLAAFNRNWTHLMFSGHGAPDGWGLESGDFSESNASSLTGMTAFVYTDACMTSHFDKNSNSIDGYSYTTEPCLAESFLRNARALGGAVAYIGCSRYGWGEPDATPADNTANGGTSTIYAYKFYDRMYETAGRTLGVAFAMHKADMASQCASNEAERWVQFGLNLLGDPALQMPTGEATPAAPTFTSAATFNATANVAAAFSVAADGSPAPVLALRSTTASSGYSFTAGTGALLYTAPDADIGSRTFTFTASNSQGVATQTVTATVSAGPPAAPASIWASATNGADFTAAWSAVGTATGYRLDVATNSSFTDAGGAAGTLLNEGFDGGITAPDGWTFTAIGGTYTTAGNYGLAAPSLKMDATGDALQTPALASPTNVSFWIKGQGATGSSLLLEAATGGSWSTITNIATLPTTGTTISCRLGTSVTNLRFTYTRSAGNLSFDDVVVLGGGGGGPASCFVPGYSNRTVAGTSQGVTGLTAGATYYFRACAVNAAGTGTYSSVASVTTVSTPVAPAFAAIPDQAATVGVLFTLNAASYASGNPAPVLTLHSTTATSGYSFASGTLSFTPAATGTFAFVFRASNTLGIASATANVAVAESSDLLAPVVRAASGVQATQFNANWTASANATGYRLDVATNSLFRHTMGRRTATLGAGDLVIVTMNADTNGTGKGFDAVPLVDLDAGTVIYFTDNGWSNGTWRTGEGTVTYTAPDAVAAGTVLSYRSTTANGFTANASFNLSTSGDTILAYQGSSNSPSFLFGAGWAIASPWIESGALSANSSMVPAGLSTSTYTIVTCGNLDNYQYLAANGTTGSKGSLLQWTANAGNWTGDDTTPFAKFTPNFTVGEVEQYNDFVAGYENRDAGNATTCVVTGLMEGVTYYYRVKATNASSNSPYSGTTSVVTTASAGTPPVVDTPGAMHVLVGRTLSHTVTATRTEDDPILSFGCASAVNAARWTFNTNSGAFTFTPRSNEVGTVQFDFTATDKDGASAPATLSVTVCAPPPVTHFGCPTNGGPNSLDITETLTNLTYALEYTTNLLEVPPNWVQVDSATGTGGAISLEDGAPAGIQRYYRIVIP